ncbi:MAG: SDR family NAD(P)-dependent oxidoreductase [Solirubrobacterales bacterium]
MTTITPDETSRSLEADALTGAFDSFMPAIEGKTAIITGGTRGIGRALTLYFAKLGATVITNGRDSALLEQVAQASADLRGTVLGVAGDIANPSHRQDVVEAAEQAGGQVDILLNNAGATAAASLAEMTPEQWRYVLAINLDAVFEMTQLASRTMRERGAGKIVNLSSILGTTALAEHANYCVSKGGIEQLTRCLAVEWSPLGVNVNAIAPGYVKTRMNHEYRNDDAFREAMLASIPAGRFGELEDIVGPALFLSSPFSDYCHGAILAVDGAYLCR